MDRLVQEYEPYAMFTLFKHNTEDYAEYREIKEGVIGAAKLPPSKVVSAIIDGMTISQEDKTIKGLIPDAMIGINPSPVYYTPPRKYAFTLSRVGKSKQYHIWMPAMINVLMDKQFLTFAVNVKSKDSLTGKEFLKQYPIPNLYSGGRMCYGAAETWKTTTQSHTSNYKLIFPCLFGVSFTQEVHNAYLYEKLINLYDELESVDKMDKAFSMWSEFLKSDTSNRTLNSFIS